ncbi:MAG: hypothetical protein NTY20_04235 [Candidatus Aenigmarchaeota archaeon]|nr:hypothetical protein [Candidatus Aenigmarchaeota archaeon]
MKKLGIPLLIIFVLLAASVHGLELFSGIPGVRCTFDRWSLTIEKGDIKLVHDGLRDHIYLRIWDKSSTAIDLGCDGMIDIIFLNGKMLLREACPHEYAEIEMKIALWKEEIRYTALVEMWKQERERK